MAAKSAELIARKDVLNIAGDAEDDMYKIYDLALILNGYLVRRERITDEMQAALAHLSGDLCCLGRSMRALCDRLYETGRGEPVRLPE